MSERVPSAIGIRLREARTLAGVTSARELDRLAGIAEGHTNLLETVVGDVKASTLEKLATVLGVSLDWLIKGEGKPPTDRVVKAAVETARQAYAVANNTKPAA